MTTIEQERLRELAASTVDRISSLPYPNRRHEAYHCLLAAVEPYRAALARMETTPAKEWRAMRDALLGEDAE